MLIVEGKIRDRVAVIYGRFQPLTKAHYDMIKKAMGMYQDVYVFPVQAESTYKLTAKTPKGREAEKAKKMSRSPFPLGLRIELILKAFPELDSSHVLKLKTGSIEYVYDQLRKMHTKKGINKIDVYAGEDEFDSYKQQVEYMKKKPEYSEVDVDVRKYDTGTREEVSATKLRTALAAIDADKGFELYKQLVAPPLADRATYNRLRKAIKILQNLDIEESMPSFMKTIKEETDMKFREALVEQKAVVSALKSQGKAKHKSDDEYCPIELEIGRQVEKEHVDSDDAAKEIAKDHLEENPMYYTKVLAPKEKEVKDIALKVMKKNGYNSFEELWAAAKKKMEK